MVYLDDNKKLSWEEIKPYLGHFRKKITREFLILYRKYSQVDKYPFKWGDEVEFSLFKFDHENKRVHLLLKAEKFFDYVKNNQKIPNLEKVEFHKEYMSYMVESTPGEPFKDSLDNFINLENNIKLRSEIIQNFLDKDEYVLSLTCFPLLGVEGFTWPNYISKPNTSINRSVFIPEEALLNNDNMLACCKTLVDRKNRETFINVPIFVDKNTPQPFIDDLSKFDQLDKKFYKPNHIFLDDGAFGMGCCCLQVTFQTESMCQAKHLYDQLTPVTPIVLALSACSPVWKGYLSNIDCRYNIIKEAFDDRTTEELSLLSARYDTIELYLSDKGQKYNDLEVPYFEEAYETFTKEKVDDSISKHFSNYFLRDPLMISKEDLLHENDDEFTGNFNLISTTVWRMLRFKVPPFKSPENNDIGWRIEFRPTELQLTAFENTAFATFIILVTRAIASNPNINLLIPLSQVKENMDRAVKINACLEEKFYFKLDALKDNDKTEEMTVDEIINGSERFKGLIPLIYDYLDKHHSKEMNCRTSINSYLKVIELRASGRVLTAASWMRKCIKDHPKYKNDSKVTQEIAYDLMWRIKQIEHNEIDDETLIPNFFRN